MAFAHMAIPATSVPSEDIFSKAGSILQRRNTLKPKTLQARAAYNHGFAV